MSVTWRIEMLGGLCVQRGEITMTRFRTHKAAALLAYLALHPRRQHAREELADRFWPDADPEAARLSLRAALSALRRQFEDYGDEPLLVTHGNHSVSLNPALFTTDVAEFEAAAKAKRGGDARRLYLGPLLPGFYEDWALQERERLEEVYAQACAETANDAIVSAPVATALLPDAAPRLRLPPDLLCLFGRDEELNRLGDLLAENRCVTLLGPGGIGKTRLALAAARRYAGHFEGGAAFVPLAEVMDTRRILPAIRDALHLPPNAREEPLEQIAGLLGERPYLLVLDNLEQVAAGGGGAVQSILSRLPGLTCLITSRRRLGIPGERQFTVAPLVAEAGVRLFVDRAEAANPDFLLTERNRSDIMALVADLEGIPLAIELAAARASSLTPAEIRERLRERFALLATRQRDKSERHRSLWAAMDWSYRLLTPEQRRLFVHLSVFRGGWTTRAAETVCEEPSALEYLAQLRERSLIQSEETTGETRWRMLESLREFATEQLTAEEKQTRNQRHVAFFRDLSERLSPRLRESDAAVHLDALERDHDNLRAAWDTGDTETRLHLGAALWRFWQIRGHYAEGRARLSAVLLTEKVPSPLRSAVLLGAGTLAYDQGDQAVARELLNTAIQEASAVGDETTAGKARNSLGLLEIRQGRFAEARSLLEEGLAAFRAVHDEEGESAALANLGLAYFREGRLEEARPCYEDALAIDRRTDDLRGVSFLLNNLGNLHSHVGNLAEARRCHEESLSLKRELNDQTGIVSSVSNLGVVALRENHIAEARMLHREALERRIRLGLRHGIRDSFLNLAAVARAEKDYGRAVRLWGVVESIAESLGVPVSPVEEGEEAEARAELRVALGESAYQQALAEGRALSLNDAIAFGLR